MEKSKQTMGGLFCIISELGSPTVGNTGGREGFGKMSVYSLWPRVVQGFGKYN